MSTSHPGECAGPYTRLGAPPKLLWSQFGRLKSLNHELRAVAKFCPQPGHCRAGSSNASFNVKLRTFPSVINFVLAIHCYDIRVTLAKTLHTIIAGLQTQPRDPGAPRRSQHPHHSLDVFAMAPVHPDPFMISNWRNTSSESHSLSRLRSIRRRARASLCGT